MKSFKEYIADERCPDDLEEGFMRTASIGALGVKHRSLKTVAIQKLKSSIESTGKVSAQKDIATKLDLLAETFQDQAHALLNFAEMSGTNFSVSAVAAIMNKQQSRSSSRRRR
jgi:hypothetical protein